MFTSLNQTNKQLFKDMIKEIRPNYGPWFEVMQLH
jgi:ABC-type cobalt transport system substrate-binding protein